MRLRKHDIISQSVKNRTNSNQSMERTTRLLSHFNISTTEQLYIWNTGAPAAPRPEILQPNEYLPKYRNSAPAPPSPYRARGNSAAAINRVTRLSPVLNNCVRAPPGGSRAG
ncbi:hypothetical protein EVAR_62328_1 [Eumeta japonica]|uniref:Uncharacterized protein n=1 Tax=Eumeta variegata TaxID=151549 RepID=A0A4C1Z575_EUMVA|nr:hypothetical protein EVAR_62328_1 [Eumeta japonica]